MKENKHRKLDALSDSFLGWITKLNNSHEASIYIAYIAAVEAEKSLSLKLIPLPSDGSLETRGTPDHQSMV